ncbi:ribosomal protein L11 [Candidatus Methanoperedens nitroreducens]|uniref:Large ribosomal subunit protein uL11 n=1 Tax=Candidatus Methanoperedens nitratireducens TaxID=1392998 RepID=A0A062V0Z1_9EURY|nr:50S ribosomal protein L11 [Candidatus Methanoperedens nitroreducens]KCZ70308.1 ribosomal protein L11 [Candidatus Methanoperedens nitroreducens]MDJ1421346.1 50S ribosomal protein L11 [Candidatus Methanoperedens sp.]
MVSVVEALVVGGQATPGPPLGPALGPLGVNVKAIIDKINEQTADFKGMQIPIKIIVDDKKQFTIQVGTPPTSALIKKEIGTEKGSGTPGTQVVGNLTVKQAVKIARMKKNGTLSKSLKNIVKEVIGSCAPLGVTFEGMNPKEATAAIDSGKFDSELSEPL